MNLSARSFQENLAHMSWWLIAVALLALTLIFGFIYFLLSLYFPADGLVSSDPLESVSFLTCIYFSIVTESTLGDGVISPHGAARVVVSFQVLFGLVIAGILVAKVTSAPSIAVARLARKVEGDWVDCVASPENQVVGRTILMAGRDGLSFQGTDYRADGPRIDSFIANVLTVEKDKAHFSFQCFDFERAVFTHGVTKISFSDFEDGEYTRYAIRITDSSGVTFPGQGFRLAWTGMEEELRDPSNCSPEAIVALAAKFKREKQDMRS